MPFILRTAQWIVLLPLWEWLFPNRRLVQSLLTLGTAVTWLSITVALAQAAPPPASPVEAVDAATPINPGMPTPDAVPTLTPEPTPTATRTPAPTATATLPPPPTATATPPPPTATPTPTPPPTSATPAGPTATPLPQTGACHPSYPDFCIPPPPPD